MRRWFLNDAWYGDFIPSELIDCSQPVNAYDALWMGVTGMLML